MENKHFVEYACTFFQAAGIYLFYEKKYFKAKIHQSHEF